MSMSFFFYLTLLNAPSAAALLAAEIVVARQLAGRLAFRPIELAEIVGESLKTARNRGIAPRGNVSVIEVINAVARQIDASGMTEETPAASAQQLAKRGPGRPRKMPAAVQQEGGAI